MSANTGGPAFPGIEFYDEKPIGQVRGMTLRDYFAGQVISQCHITVTREEPEPDAEVIRIFAERYARTAYVIADAMLRARAGAGALLLCLLLPSLAHAQGAVGGEHHEWWLHGAIFASGVAAAADLSSTSWALGKSGDRFSESNPALRWASDDPVKLAVAKMTVDGAVVWALIKIHPTHPKLAVTIAVAKTAVSAWAAHRNAKTVGLR